MTSCRIGDRTAASDVPSLKILDPAFEEYVKVDPFQAASIEFPGEDRDQCLPFAPALAAVCQDHFVFQSAESQGGAAVEPMAAMEMRLIKAMEEMISDLTQQLSPVQTVPTPTKKMDNGRDKGKGLDDAVVQQALRTWVCRQHSAGSSAVDKAGDPPQCGQVEEGQRIGSIAGSSRVWVDRRVLNLHPEAKLQPSVCCSGL